MKIDTLSIHCCLDICRENNTLAKKMALLENRLSTLEKTVALLQRSLGQNGVPSSAPPSIAKNSNNNIEHAVRVRQSPLRPPKKKAKAGVEPAERGGPRVDQGLASTKLKEMFTYLMGDDSISEQKVKMAVNIIQSKSVTWDIEEMTLVAYNTLMECAKKSYSVLLAPIQWAPCSWFADARSRNKFHGMNVSKEATSSLVAMWCCQNAIEHGHIPWLLKFIHTLDQIPSHQLHITDSLLSKCTAETLSNIDKNDKNTSMTITRLCCASTLAMTILRSCGDINRAAAFIVDIVMECKGEEAFSLKEQKSVICLAVALEAWPAAIHNELGDTYNGLIQSLIKRYESDRIPSRANSLPTYYSICHYASIFIHNALDSFMPHVLAL